MTPVATTTLELSFFDNLSAGRLDLALASMADTAGWWVAGGPEQFALAGSWTRAEFLEMLAVMGAAMPDGVRVSIDCRLLRGVSEVAVTATWDLDSLDAAVSR
ncbi:MAG TPA: hypothetical protein VGL20_10275 [Candidatus Dormibacteraeota bacterium]|jgi:hypothetical protein